MSKIKEFANDLAKMEAIAFNIMINKNNNNPKNDEYIDYFG